MLPAKIRALGFLIFFVFACFLATAQKQANNWFFGNGNGLTFNIPSPGLIQGLQSNSGGTASISDKNGNLLFYTDGQTVWNKQHSIMVNGSNLSGFPGSSEPALVIPFNEGISPKYYIFTTDGGAGLNDSVFSYSIVDMSLQNGLGMVIEKNTILFRPSYQIMASVKHKNGRDTWVLSHQDNTDLFYAYLVTSCGISSPVVSKIGLRQEFIDATMKFSPNGEKVAVSLSRTGNLCLFDFDTQSGFLSNFGDFGAGSGGYGLCFSPNSHLLYVTNGTYVKQYNLSAGDFSNIILSEAKIYTCTIPEISFSISNAPDGKMYILKVESTYLDVISQPDQIGMACNYIVDAFKYTNDKNTALGLPSFIESYFDPEWKLNQLNKLSFSSDRVCYGDSSTFTLSYNSTFPVKWIFDDPLSGINNSSLIQNPKHKFSRPGKYSVTLIHYVTCVPDTISEIALVDSFPSLDLGPDRSICEGEPFKIDIEDGFISFLWNDQSTYKSKEVNSAGLYKLTISNSCGSSSDSILVTEFKIRIPNLITPNNDGENDSLKICGIGENSGTLTIYNQWGSEIYNNISYNNEWSGDGLVEGIYFYRFGFQTCKPQHGWVHILK